jgi:hypothetical protein
VADGSVRAGLNPGDVLLLMGYLWRVAPGPDGLDQGGRLTAIVLDGIRPREQVRRPARPPAPAARPPAPATRRSLVPARRPASMVWCLSCCI